MPPTTPPTPPGPAVDEQPGADTDEDRAEHRARKPEPEPGEDAREGDAGGNADADRDPDHPPLGHVYGLPISESQCTDGTGAPPSNRRITSTQNAPARAPSTTRWSKVTETLPI